MVVLIFFCLSIFLPFCDVIQFFLSKVRWTSSCLQSEFTNLCHSLVRLALLSQSLFMIDVSVVYLNNLHSLQLIGAALCDYNLTYLFMWNSIVAYCNHDSGVLCIIEQSHKHCDCLCYGRRMVHCHCVYY